MITLLSAFIVHLPTLLVWVIGLLVAIISWSKHPKISLLTTIALSGFIALAMINAFLTGWLPTIFARGMSPAQLGTIFAAMNLCTSIISAGLWGIVLFAIFSPRTNRSSN